MGNSYSNFIKGVYRKNSRAIMGTKDHSLSVDVEEYNVEHTKISFDSKDMPYFKLALVDRHLEEITNDEPYYG